MRRITCAVAAAALLCGGVGFAQPAASGNPPEDAAAESPEEDVAPAPQAPAAPLKGDVIRLKNGKILSDVQVLRETPSTIEVQVHPALDPLILPRRQIASIDYDKRDPNRPGFDMAEEPEAEPDVLVAQQVPESLRPLLTKPIFVDRGFSVTDRDFLILINNQSRRAGITVEVSEQVRAMPEAERLWTVDLPAGTQFLSLLEHLRQSYPQLKVDFTDQKVMLRTRAEVEEQQKSANN